MAKTRSMTRKQKRLKTSEDGGSASWSDLFRDLLIIVMMRLGLVDFVSFSGVCKRWRSIAHSEWKTFMGCKVPMCMFFFTSNRRGLRLEDFEGRRFKTIRRHVTHRTCVGSTRGYLIMFGSLIRDFWLVNPITRHEFHFTDFPWNQDTYHPAYLRGILVYSRSMSGWVFVVSHKLSNTISFSLAGKHTRWNHIFSSVPILDMHLFKGKIYSLNILTDLCEVKLEPEPTLLLIRIKNFTMPKTDQIELVSSGKNLYVVGWVTKSMYKVLEVNFDTMEWENPEKTVGQYAFYFSGMCTSSAAASAIEPNTQACGRGRTQSNIICFRSEDQIKKESGLRTLATNMWYFPQDCLNVKLALMGEMEDYCSCIFVYLIFI
ncbi:F-box domain-containing protein [Artemisia annua]|uniref:F-box domain-containing protein n=1 Tax=Artemisia annua TaxID=35608 RepID=A0A2U1KRJ2_ARTAN|nr:F-box domain-containing protein [Artemisia annua]